MKTEWYQGDSFSYSSLHIKSHLNTLVGLSVQRNLAERYLIKRKYFWKRTNHPASLCFCVYQDYSEGCGWNENTLMAQRSPQWGWLLSTELSCRLLADCSVQPRWLCAFSSSTQWIFSKVLWFSQRSHGTVETGFGTKLTLVQQQVCHFRHSLELIL